ncbi:MAG: hypothetical protein LBP32_08185, partial [Spirochaetaceae bacterium]|nr:hypothetical protein [Spirochaetaceae bacterium]
MKKTFFDLWDNLFKIALLNIGFIASVAVLVLAPPHLESVPPLAMAVIFAGFSWCVAYLSAAALSLKAISEYGSFGLADFFANLRIIWPAGLVMGLLIFLIRLLITIIIPFYLGMGSMAGLLLAAFTFWTLAAGILSFQFFLAACSRLDAKLTKALKKCFLFFFDNPLFCVFILILNVAILALSIFPFLLLFPGPAGILLFLDEALRLRLLKYDWLKANPDPAGGVRR